MKRFDRKKTPHAFAGRLPQTLRALWRPCLFWALTLLLWEWVFQLSASEPAPLKQWLYAPLFTISLSLLLTALERLLPSKLANRIVQYVLLGVLYLVYAVQLIYRDVFGSLLSLAYIAMGAEAIGNFWITVLLSIRRCLPQLLTMALPFPILAVYQHRGVLERTRRPWSQSGLLLATSVLLFVLASLPVWISGTRGLPGSVYYDSHTTVDRQSNYFGLLTAERLEIGRLLHGSGSLNLASFDLTQSSGEHASEEEDVSDRNILPELDFAALDELTDDEALLELNEYFAGLAGTSKNEYTGFFQGYNLIEICAESFSPYLIDPELTPTLYRLSHEGFVFENFYNPFPNVTTNGEYTMCMGLMPDLSRRSFAASMTNYVPFCLGNLFGQAGYTALAYHNNIGSFYNRINTHPNMGYDFRAIDCGLDMVKDKKPTSDLEMMEKTVDEYLDSEPFVVHYMTYSGHMEYSFENNAMSAKNEALVADIDAPEAVRAYYACNLELEKALAYLVERLEETGLDQRTVIVLSGDHLPYGLTDEEYAALAGEAVDEDPFWRYRNSFICWTGAMDEPIVVDEYCCTQDILPTMLNLFGAPYDSRLLTGRDVFSDGIHAALIQDGSFLTKTLTYDAGSGEITWHGEAPGDDPDGYASELIAAMENEFTVAASILRNDYYRFAFESLGLATIEDHEKVYASFADTDGTWYEAATERLVERGALSGTNDGKFEGAEPATRATVLAMLSRTLYLESSDEAAMSFTDVPENAWYRPELSAAVQAGIYPDGQLFRYNTTITAGEAETLLYNSAVYAGIPNAKRWSAEAAERVLSEAAAHGENTTTKLSRGTVAALIAALIDELDALEETE